MYYWVKLRSALNTDQSVVYGFQEIRAQPRALFLLPDKCVFDIRGGCRTDNHLHQVRRLLMRR
jgi:hypothetical protein